MVRDKYLETVSTFQPFTSMIEDGMSPSDIKGLIIAILNPYVFDKEMLEKHSVTFFANEAIGIANLLLREDLKEILDQCFSVRNSAILKNKIMAFQTMAVFEVDIREAQSKYHLQILSEQSKADLSLEEYSFEMFRIIGTVIESTLKPFLKEFYCMAMISSGKNVEVTSVQDMDLGKVTHNLEVILKDSKLASPLPWKIKLNQWRNIAQHLTYLVVGDQICISYGMGANKVEAIIKKEDLFLLSKEIMRRLSALKCSREITIANHANELRLVLPTPPDNPYTAATELGAAFSTQGFKLEKLYHSKGKVTAYISDSAPESSKYREIHCSQFTLVLGNRFKGNGIEIFFRSAKKMLRFSLEKEDVVQISNSDNQSVKLAELLNREEVPD